MKQIWVKTMNSELKNMVARMESAMNSRWVNEARRFAKRQNKEIRRNLAALQRRIPGEVDRLKTYVTEQRKEINTLISEVRKNPRMRVRVKLTPKGLKIVNLKKDVMTSASPAKKAASPRAKSKKASQAASDTVVSVPSADLT
ncbi:MAG: hypothetical protein AAB425_05385 [Bdellovibrionota bacterium]